MDNIVFFYGGPFSQWYRSKFTIDGVVYNTAEQYMMAKKALLFGDYQMLEAIMDAKDPWVQKQCGKLVKNFDKEIWEKHCKKFVYDANYAKFIQDNKLTEYLLDTGDKELVEASPTDCIWGIGLSEDDPARLDKNNWRGTNWLGIEIMNVRKAFTDWMK